MLSSTGMQNSEPGTTRVSIRRQSGLAWDAATFTIRDEELYRFGTFIRGFPGILEVGPEVALKKSVRMPEDQKAIEEMNGL